MEKRVLSPQIRKHYLYETDQLTQAGMGSGQHSSTYLLLKHLSTAWEGLIRTFPLYKVTELD